MDKDKVKKDNKNNKYNKHNKLESYNFLKSIKEKEKTVLDYYKRINSRIQIKPLPKPKKLTRKNLIDKNYTKDKVDGKDDELDNTKEKDNKREKPKTKIAPRGEESKKHVIMD
jgi:hypothetical protein